MNYSQMTDEELRVEIAKAKGWKRFTSTKENLPIRNVWLRNPDFSADNEYWIDSTSLLASGDYVDGDIPDWPTSIADAWELVEEAEKVNVGFSLANMKYVESKEIVYEAIFFDEWGGPITEQFRDMAQTAPRAICLAWLPWKKETE